MQYQRQHSFFFDKIITFLFIFTQLTHSKMNFNSSVKFQSAKRAVLPGSIDLMTEVITSGDANRKGDL